MSLEGRALDAAVHRACGRECERRQPSYPEVCDPGEDWCYRVPIGNSYFWHPIPEYSADPAAALAALEAFCDRMTAADPESDGVNAELYRDTGPPARWVCKLVHSVNGTAGQGFADTLPLAACRAILAAAGAGGGADP